MDQWQDISDFAWHQGTGFLIGGVLLAALLLYRFKPGERRTLGNSLIFFTLCLAGLLISGIIHSLGFAKTAAAMHEIFIVAEGLAVLRLGGLFVFRIALPAIRLSPPSILEDLLVILGYLVWGMVRLRYAGLDLSSIVTTSAVITAVIAFSMQDTLGNILGGLALELDNSFEIGDWIKIDDVVGKVVDIRWRSTSVETRNWETVVIPNSALMKSKFSGGRNAGEALDAARSGTAVKSLYIPLLADFEGAPAINFDEIAVGHERPDLFPVSAIRRDHRRQHDHPRFHKQPGHLARAPDIFGPILWRKPEIGA